MPASLIRPIRRSSRARRSPRFGHAHRALGGETLEERRLLVADITLVDAFPTWAGGLIMATDPAGIEYHAPSGHLYIVDSEIDATPYWNGVNVFEINLEGDTLYRQFDSANREPTGLAYNGFNGSFYMTNDDEQSISVHDIALNNSYRDYVTTNDLPLADDTEGITADPATGMLYVVDGEQGTLQVLVYNADLVFQYSFPLGPGMTDGEGIAFNSATGRLFVVSANEMKISEYTTAGALIDTYDISDFSPAPIAPQGLTFAPTSDPFDSPSAQALYIADGGIDNEPDGYIYEAVITGDQPPLGDNRVPLVDAGPTRYVILPNVASLDGTVTDDGLPTIPGFVTTTWSLVSGPGPVTFGNASAIDTTATFPTAGIYRLALAASDGALTGRDIVTVYVNSLEDRTNHANDDAEQNATTGAVTRSSPDLELVYDSGGNQTVGMRFDAIQIPQGATITRAYVQFQAYDQTSVATNLTIRGQAADNAARFTSTAYSISSRPQTVASATWNPEPWLANNEAGLKQRTGNLAPIIQEIVSRPGWVAGNALALIVTGTGERVAESYDGLHHAAPLLYVEFGQTLLAPITNDIPDVSVHQGDANPVVDLFAAFDDVDDPDSTLTFSVIGNTNPGLFDATPINGSAGTLTLDYAAGAIGFADVTVRATDPDGLYVDTSFNVAVRAPLGNISYIRHFNTWTGSAWSTDPAGLTYHAPSGSLYVVDSEINQLPIFNGNNIWRVPLDGATVQQSITSGNDEPTDITYNEFDGYFYVSNDTGQRYITRYNSNLNAPLLERSTLVDVATANDPEGITSDPATGRLYVSIGNGSSDISVMIYDVTPSALVYVSSFSLEPHLQDAEGIAFHPPTGHLLIVDGDQNKIFEFTTTGTLLREFDLSGFSPLPIAPQGLAFAPTSNPNDDPAAMSLYITDGMGDEVYDGRVYETNISLNTAPTTSGIDNVTVAQNAPDYVVNLFPSFADAETPDNQLVYSVVANSNSSLFTSTTVNSPAGTLTLDFSPTGAGTSNLTVRATDTGGLFVETTFTVTVTAAPTTLEVRIAQSSDDAEERPTGSMRLTSGDLDMVLDSGEVQISGMRFPGLTIPPGATITNAYIQFKSQRANSTATNLTIRGQATDHATTFTSTKKDITNRPATSTQVAWTPANWTAANLSGVEQRTPNLAGIVQEIVNRPGWLNGNGMAFVVTGTGERGAYARDGSTTGAPLLHVEYTTGGNTPPTTSGIANVSVVENAPNYVVDLFPSFADAQTPDNQLVYSVQANTNPALFTSTVVNSPAGTLTLDFAPVGFGSANLTVRATDVGGLYVETTFTVTVSSASTVLEVRIAQSSDDAEQRPSGAMRLTSSDLDMVLDTAEVQITGLRFPSLTIPQGATITSAYIQFRSDAADSVATNLTIRAQAADHATTFTSSTGNITSRPLSSAQVAWNPPAWTAANLSGPDQRTPNLTSLVQEVVNRPGWVNGNGMAFVITGSGERNADSWDGAATAAPLLHVEYIAGGPLRAAFEPVRNSQAANLTKKQLTSVVAGAIARLSDDEAAVARRLRFEIASLPGDLLGFSRPGVVQIDRNAAGAGWFVDRTPLDDSEFARQAGSDLLAALPGTRAAERVDLLTVVLHEIGHALGHEHGDGSLTTDSELGPGARRSTGDLAHEGHVDAFFANLGD